MDEVSVIVDPKEVKNLLNRGTITDINAFIKQQAKNNPDLVKDPVAFEAQWDEDKAKRMVAEFKAAAPEGIGTKRAELQDVLEAHGSGLAEAFDDLTDRQKAYGRITSKLSFAKSVDDVEKLFSWAEVEFGALSWREKVLCMFQAGELIGTTPVTYRGIRKIFLAMVQGNTVEIKPEYLQAQNRIEATQKAVCAKLIKAKSVDDIETVFDWAEVELNRQLVAADRYIIFFQIAEMIPFTEEHFKAIRKIFIKMSKE